MVDGRDSAWRNRAPGPHAHRNSARQATDGLWTEARGQHKQSNDPAIFKVPTKTASWTPALKKAAKGHYKLRGALLLLINPTHDPVSEIPLRSLGMFTRGF
jgi:hypothetical protein